MIMNYSLQFHKVVLGKAILKGIHCSRGGGEGKLEYLQEILPQINIKFFTSFNFPGCQNSYFLAKLWFFKSYVHFLNMLFQISWCNFFPDGFVQLLCILSTLEKQPGFYLRFYGRYLMHQVGIHIDKKYEVSDFYPLLWNKSLLQNLKC